MRRLAAASDGIVGAAALKGQAGPVPDGWAADVVAQTREPRAEQEIVHAGGGGPQINGAYWLTVEPLTPFWRMP